MAAGQLSEPGTEYGPCLDECAHVDCAESRTMAATSCVHCGEPIGYGVNFVKDDQKRLVHFVCELTEVERAQAAYRP